MNDEIIREMNQYHKQVLSWIYYTIFINLALGIITALNIIPYFFIILITVFIVSIVLMINGIIVNYKKWNALQKEEFKNIIRHADFNWNSTKEKFNKDEVMDSVLFSKYGSFRSGYKVNGIQNNIPYEFSYVNNLVSSGQSSYYVFCGTYIVFDLKTGYKGVFQIKNKRQYNNYKKFGVYKILNRFTEQYKNDKIDFFTNDDSISSKFLTEGMISFYKDIKNRFKSGLYFSIFNNKFVIGIDDRKNYLSLGFRKIDEDTLQQKITELRKIGKVISDTCSFLNSNKIN